LALLVAGCARLAGAPAAGDPHPTIELATPGPPPAWAFWQRQLLDQLYPAALEFVRLYTRPDGTLIWREHWPGMDGSEDGLLIHLWCVSQDPEDYTRIGQMADSSRWQRLAYQKAKGDYGHEGPWLRFLEGQYPDYPAQILEATYGEALRRLALARTESSRPEDRNVHHGQEWNPVVLEGLVQTMLGGPNYICHGGLLHVRLRYHDALRRRPGVPPDVAALVDRLSSDSVGVQLVNLHATENRELIVQAGAFGEHQFISVNDGRRTQPVNAKWLRVILKPGTVARLDLGMSRHANSPSYAMPWTAG
jgi:hypothetical protein